MQAPQGALDGRHSSLPEPNPIPSINLVGGRNSASPNLRELSLNQTKWPGKRDQPGYSGLKRANEFNTFFIVILSGTTPSPHPLLRRGYDGQAVSNHAKSRVNTLKYAYARVNTATGEKLFPAQRAKLQASNLQAPENVQIPTSKAENTRAAKRFRFGACDLVFGASLDVGAWTLGAYPHHPASNL
jgi:hypothetical protein